MCKMQSQVHHEKRGAANAASFFADGLSATIHTVQQVLLCAVLLNVHSVRAWFDVYLAADWLASVRRKQRRCLEWKNP